MSASGDTPRSSASRRRARPYEARAAAGRPVASWARISTRHSASSYGSSASAASAASSAAPGSSAASAASAATAARPSDQRRAPLPLGGHPGALVVREQRPPRQGERGGCSGPGGGAAAVVERLDRLAHARRQLIDVEPVGDEGEAGVGAHDPLDAEHPAKSRHEHAHLLGRPRRQIDVPQRVGERRRRHRRATGDGEHLERGPRLATPERRVGDVLDDEATEEADTQRAGRAAHGRRC